MIKRLLIFIVYLLIWNLGYSQSGIGDPTFNPFDTSTGHGAGLDNNDVTGDIYDDGKVIISGVFTTFNGNPVGNIIRLNSDGTLDSSFNNTHVLKYGYDLSKPDVVKILANGKILIGGRFNKVNGVAIFNLIRLNSDGSIDTTFTTGVGMGNTNNNASVKALAVQPDGKILVGGDFITYRNMNTNNLLRLNADGNVDVGFNYSTGAWYNSNIANITAIEVLSNGKIAVGGDFDTFNGVAKRSLVLLDSNGNIDPNFNTITTGILGENNASQTFVYVIEDAGGGKFYVGGTYKFYNGFETKNLPIVKIDQTGNLDTSFAPDRNLPFENRIAIHAIKILNDNSIYLGGDFNILQNFNQVTNSFDFNHYNIAHLSATGTLDNNFKVEVFDGSLVTKINVTPNNKVTFVCATNYLKFLDIGKKGVIKVDNLGNIDMDFHKIHGINGSMANVHVQSDNKILACGEFYSHNQSIFTSTKPIVRLTENGLLDQTFSFSDPDFYRGDKAVELSTGKIAALFLKFDSVNRSNFVILNANGSIDPNFNIDNYVKNALLFLRQPDDKIVLLYEDFQNRKLISRFNLNGTKDSSFIDQEIFITPHSGSIYQMAIQSTGKIILTGPYMRIGNDQNINNIHRLNSNGTRDTTFAFGLGFNYAQNVRIAVNSLDQIYVANAGIEYNGTAISFITRLTPDGAIDTSFAGMHHFVDAWNILMYDVKVDKYDNVYFLVNSYNYSLNYNEVIVKFNADGTYNSTFTSNLKDSIKTSLSSFDFQKDNKLVVLGYFSSINSLRNVNIGRINNCDDHLNSVSISLNAGDLSTSLTDHSYQWVRCDLGNQEILGATASTFTPTVNGTYALVVKNGGCPVQSNCIEVTNLSVENFEASQVNVYPNPTTGDVQVILPTSVDFIEAEVYDVSGRLIDKKNFENSYQIPLTLLGNSGVYIIKIKTPKFTISRKVILK